VEQGRLRSHVRKPDHFQNYVVDESPSGWVMSLSAVLTVRKPPTTLTVIAVPGQDLLLKIIYHCDRFDGSIVTAIIQDLQQVLAWLQQ